jgi:glucan phosphoethanolaminetransferase (alkaline phosphatase superfamily)
MCKPQEIFETIKKISPYPLILGVMLLLPNIMALFLAQDLHHIGTHAVYCTVTIALFLLPACLFKARTFFALQSGLLFIAPIELSHLFMYRKTSSILYVYTMLISESGELTEMISTIWPLIIFYLIFIVAYYVILTRHIANTHIFSKLWRTGLGIGFVLVLMFLGSLYVIRDRSSHFHLPVESVFNEQNDGFMKQGKTFPVNIYTAMWNIVSSNIRIQKEQEKLKNFSFGITPKKDNTEEVYVLIIGETTRYGNMGINGYERNTTPLLSQCSNVVSFDSIYSVANLTAVSLPFMLTRATPQTAEVRYNEKSVAEAFAEAGFYTAWIANQSFRNDFLHRIANNCSYSYYETHAIDSYTGYDMNLLSHATPLLPDKSHPKKFIVLHSLGCHFKYNYRYPKAFAQFQPAFEDDFNVRQIVDRANRQLLLNAYDNAVLYTDFFIYNTIEMLRSLETVSALLYISDHGENLFDDERNLFLHGSYAGSNYEYHVPMIVWTSDAYNAKYPDKVAALKANKSKTQSSGVVFHSLLDIADISYCKFDSTLSIVRQSLASDSVIYGIDANWELKIVHGTDDKMIRRESEQPDSIATVNVSIR